jgi:ABC-type uncharacterized transport system involved in gliding motility auxiliary subunit
MERLATPALFLGLGGVVAGFLVQNYRPSWTRAWPVLLIVGGLVLLFGLYASFATNVRRALAGRATRSGLNAIVLIVLILGVIVLVEAVSYRHSYRVDLTENKRWSLSPQSVKVVSELSTPVKAIAFFRPDQPGKRTAEDLLKQYAGRSDGKFTWEVIDADRSPLVAREYGFETYGAVALEAVLKDGQKKQEKIQDLDEEKLTNALIRVTRTGKRVVYFLRGHGEHDPSSSDRTGYAQVKAAIEKLNYEVKDLVLARETKVPDDAAIVVVAGPTKELLPAELDSLSGYVNRAGEVFVMVDPFQKTGLDPVLERWGLGLGNDVIIDISPTGRRAGAGPEIPVVTDYLSHPITRDFRFATFFPVARSVSVTDKPPAGVSAQGLARTSPESWGETNQEQIRTGQVRWNPGEARGPLTIAPSRRSTPRTCPPTGRAQRPGLCWSGTRTSRPTSSSISPATATSS